MPCDSAASRCKRVAGPSGRFISARYLSQKRVTTAAGVFAGQPELHRREARRQRREPHVVPVLRRELALRHAARRPRTVPIRVPSPRDAGCRGGRCECSCRLHRRPFSRRGWRWRPGTAGRNPRPCGRRRRARAAAPTATAAWPWPSRAACVVEDDVGRHAAAARDLEAQRAQRVEQVAVDALPRLALDARRIARPPVSASARAWAAGTARCPRRRWSFNSATPARSARGRGSRSAVAAGSRGRRAARCSP